MFRHVYHTCASHVDSIKYRINGRIFKLEILRLDNPKACVLYSYFKKPVFWTTDPQNAKGTRDNEFISQSPTYSIQYPQSHRVRRKLQGPSLCPGEIQHLYSGWKGKGEENGGTRDSDSLGTQFK